MAKKEQDSVQRFTKKALYESKRYKEQRDLLMALLDDDTEYSHDEADKLINDYLNKEVK